MRVLLTAFLAALVACAQPTTGERRPAGGSTASRAADAGADPGTRTTPADAAPAPRADCVHDAAAEQACLARGAGFEYGPQPYIYCSGVAPRPEDEQRRFDRIRNSPCACNDVAAIARRRHECARVP